MFCTIDNENCKFFFLVKQFSYENFVLSLTIFIKQNILLLKIHTLFKKKKTLRLFKLGFYYIYEDFTLKIIKLNFK